MLLDKLIPRNWRSGKYSAEPFTGECKIVRNSSLRKLARAIRRGKVPDERQVIIDEAVKNANRRMGLYGYRRPPT
jgi:hypothetical protein